MVCNMFTILESIRGTLLKQKTELTKGSTSDTRVIQNPSRIPSTLKNRVGSAKKTSQLMRPSTRLMQLSALLITTSIGVGTVDEQEATPVKEKKMRTKSKDFETTNARKLPK